MHELVRPHAMKIPTLPTALRFTRVAGALLLAGVAIFGILALPPSSQARGRGSVGDTTGVRIVSPDTAQTWAVDAVVTHYKLFWDDRKGELLALVTFTNSPRVSRWELLSEQQTRFRLPGVWLDEGSGTLYTRAGVGSGGGKGGSGRGVPVATLRGSGFLTERVRPAPGTLIRVPVDRHGVVRVILHASERPLQTELGEGEMLTGAHWEIGVPVRPF